MSEGLSRREVLKRGAIAGGALWAAPVMHGVAVGQENAEDTSPVCRVTLTVGENTCADTGQDLISARLFTVCVTGCDCDSLVLVIETAGGTVEAPTFPTGVDGCAEVQVGSGQTPLTFRGECRDSQGGVIGASASRTVEFDQSVCGPVPQTAAAVQRTASTPVFVVR